MTQAIITKFNNQIINMKREIETLRSFVISNVIKDKEGRYNHKFIQKILGSLREKPIYTFTNKKDFLSSLKK